jgi:molybdopterin molybdotransferase
MVAIDDARRLIAEHTRPLDSETIDALQAESRVLAEDVYADGPLPDLPKAAVDGYAVRASDGVQPRRVLAEITAGAQLGLRVEPGTAVRIMTGAPVPDGADAVIMVEQTEERAGLLQIQDAVRAGNSIHTVGQDLMDGQLVLRRGTLLGAPEVGLLATVGRTQIQAYRRPTVAVLATGDEVYEPGAPAIPGGVRDSNRYALMAAAREAGCATISLGIAPDDERLLRETVLSGLERADVLLTSGGVSMGTRDLIKPLLAELGAVHFGRVAFKPGKPTTFATIDRSRWTTHAASERTGQTQAQAQAAPLLVFGLPGYPVSSLVSFEVFVRPALRRLQGDAHPERPSITVVLAEPITASPDRPEYQRASVGWENGVLVAHSTGSQGSSRLLSLHGANALLLIPASGRVHQAGEQVPAILTGPLRSGGA